MLELLATLTLTTALDARPAATIRIAAPAVVQQAPLRTGAPCSLQKGVRRTSAASQRHERPSGAPETAALGRPSLPSSPAPADPERNARALPRGARLPRDPPAPF